MSLIKTYLFIWSILNTDIVVNGERFFEMRVFSYRSYILVLIFSVIEMILNFTCQLFGQKSSPAHSQGLFKKGRNSTKLVNENPKIFLDFAWFDPCFFFHILTHYLDKSFKIANRHHFVIFVIILLVLEKRKEIIIFFFQYLPL